MVQARGQVGQGVHPEYQGIKPLTYNELAHRFDIAGTPHVAGSSGSTERPRDCVHTRPRWVLRCRNSTVDVDATPSGMLSSP